MSLLSALPAPTRQHAAPIAAVPTSSAIMVASFKEAPPYLRRKGFVPRRPEDFANGGAFPEIHMAQYPLDMGRDSQAQGSKQLAVSLGSDGQLNYDAIVKQGANRGRVVHGDHLALIPKIDRMSVDVSSPFDAHTGCRPCCGPTVYVCCVCIQEESCTQQRLGHAPFL